MKKLASILVLLFLMTANAHALTGAELKKHLIEFNSSSGSLWGPYGVGYVLGVADLGNGLLFCTPSVTNKELTSIVLSYLFAHPDKLEKSADGLVVNALSAKWPCEKNQSRPSPRPTPKPSPKSESPF